MLTEQFKPINGYEGLYEVSNLGKIKSLAKNWIIGKGNLLRKPNTILKSSINNSNGYYTISLNKNAKQKTFKIALLVWDAFGDKPRNGNKLQIDHKDGVKTNDRIDNLQLLTPRENVSKGFQQKGTPYPTGVSRHEKKYISRIEINGKCIYLGYFNNIKDASNAYQTKLNELNEYKGGSSHHILNE